MNTGAGRDRGDAFGEAVNLVAHSLQDPAGEVWFGPYPALNV